jgi:Zn-dependent protease
MPLIALITNFPVIGWAKPTPVDPHNFKNPVWDDIKTSVVGPISNFVVAGGAVAVMAVISLSSGTGRELVDWMARNYRPDRTPEGASILIPLVVFFYQLMQINVVLAVFNLIPVPPLDGSQDLLHFLSDPLRSAYDSVGIFGLLALVYLGGNLLGRLISPFLGFFDSILVKL